MKLKLAFFAFAITIFAQSATAADVGFINIERRQHVVCGIDREYRRLAYQEEKKWRGFDADICRAFAAAILDDAERFKLVPIQKSAIGKALNDGVIDVMLGHSSLSSSEEAKLYVIPVDTLYYDRQVFAARAKNDATSMRDFAGQKVCVLRNSPALTSLNDYNQKYALGFKILEMPSLASAKEAFYTSRCDLISGSEIFINEIVSSVKSANPAFVLPEDIAYLPIKAYTAGSSPTLNIASRWIINALRIASAAEITSQTADTFNATKNQSLRNLLGLSPQAWEKLNLYPNWAKDYISVYGNYQQILDRNIGENSTLKLDMKQNNLIENGGFLSSQPFL